jgi:nucleotide-binding universal stress UspA family protein
VPTLLIGSGSRSFVDAQSGQTNLRRILVPLTPAPSPTRALQLLASLLSAAGVTADAFELMHVAETAPDSFDEAPVSERIERFEGPVVETILRVANERQVDLIAMPTIGDRGLLDAFRGSTTSRVISRAPCPVLTLPLISSDQ